MKEVYSMEKIKPMLFTTLKGYSKNQFVKDLISGIIVEIEYSYQLSMSDKNTQIITLLKVNFSAACKFTKVINNLTSV